LLAGLDLGDEQRAICLDEIVRAQLRLVRLAIDRR